MAPIRRFKRRQQPQQKKDAEMGFEALSLLEGKVPAGDGESSKPAAAQAEIGLEVEPGALFRFEALSLRSGNAPTVDIATTPLAERAKGDAASSESSNPPPKQTSSVTQAEMGLKRVDPESEPTKHGLPPTADDVEAVALQEKNRQPPSPPVPFVIPPVRGGSPRIPGGSTNPSPLPTQDQETDRLLKQIDDALDRVMEIRQCKMQEDLEADSLLEKSRDALKRVMAIRGGRSDAVKPSPLLAQEEIDQLGKNWDNVDEEILRLEREEVALQHSESLEREEVARYAKKFDSVRREICLARAAAQETKSTASAMALRSAHDKRVSFHPETRNISARYANQFLSLLRTRRDLAMALTVKEATPAAGAVGLKRYPLLSAKLAEHLAEEGPEMLERCCLEMDAAELQRLNDYFLKGEIAKLKAKFDKVIASIAGEAGQVFCWLVIDEIKDRIGNMKTVDLVRNAVAET